MKKISKSCNWKFEKGRCVLALQAPTVHFQGSYLRVGNTISVNNSSSGVSAGERT